MGSLSTRCAHFLPSTPAKEVAARLGGGVALGVPMVAGLKPRGQACCGRLS